MWSELQKGMAVLPCFLWPKKEKKIVLSLKLLQNLFPKTCLNIELRFAGTTN